MNKLKVRCCILVVSLFISLTSVAQEKQTTEELMRSNGKIYVVVAVCLTILLGLFFYLFLIDKKISKIEKDK